MREAESRAAKRGRILYVQYTNPAGYPPLEHSSRILAKDGWEVLFLGTGSLGSDALQFPPHERIEVRRMRFTPAGWRQKLHYLQFCLWVFFWMLRWRPRWIYASDPLPTPIALVLRYLPGLRVLYHEHDSPNTDGSSVTGRPSLFMRLVLWARKKLARRAALCVLPNEQRAERFDLETGRSSVFHLPPSLVVWNCPSVDEVSEPRAAHDGGDLWVLYQGSIVPARLPVTVLQALALLPETVKLRVIGYETVGYVGYVQEMRERARQLEIEDRVEFLKAMPRKELLNWCRKCDVGLAFLPKEGEDINQRAMTGASNKPFDYLACGLALLVSDLPDWRRLFIELGYGLACDADDPESIAVALRWFVEHPQGMRQMGERGRRQIMAEWNYEKQFFPVFERISSDLQ